MSTTAGKTQLPSFKYRRHSHCRVKRGKNGGVLRRIAQPISHPARSFHKLFKRDIAVAALSVEAAAVIRSVFEEERVARCEGGTLCSDAVAPVLDLTSMTFNKTLREPVCLVDRDVTAVSAVKEALLTAQGVSSCCYEVVV